jgi:Ca2+-binding EF-hand superfamily protein
MSIRLTGIIPAIAIGVTAWAVSAPASHAAEMLSACELETVENFKTIDADGDGVITKAEYMTCLTGGDASSRVKKEKGADITEETDEVFVEYDADGDGKITQAEFGQGSMKK